jgi:predicted GIY-YIG superfamily endonuclease
MNMRTYSLYCLIDPVVKDLRYIGISHEPQRRFRRHCLSGQQSKLFSHKQKWIGKLWQAGLIPELVILDTGLDLETAKALEIEMIAAHPHLTNGTKGGDTNAWYTFSPELKERLTQVLQTSGHAALAKIRIEEPERWMEIKQSRKAAVGKSKAHKQASRKNLLIAQQAAQASEKTREAARRNMQRAHLANRQSSEKQLVTRRANMAKALASRLANPQPPSPAQIAVRQIAVKKMHAARMAKIAERRATLLAQLIEA